MLQAQENCLAFVYGNKRLSKLFFNFFPDIQKNISFTGLEFYLRNSVSDLQFLSMRLTYLRNVNNLTLNAFILFNFHWKFSEHSENNYFSFYFLIVWDVGTHARYLLYALFKD